MRLPFAAIALGAALLPSLAKAEKVSVPVDVGVGPAAYIFYGPVTKDGARVTNGRVFDDQPVHFGLKISIAAVLDQAFIQAHQNRIPARYRKQAAKMTEVRFSPSILIPDSFFISPKYLNTGMYGVTWRPLSIGIPLTEGAARLRLGAGLLLSYFYLHSDTLPDTHFLRPGLDLKVELELAASQSFLVSMGWSSGLYIPQVLGGFAVQPYEESVFHVGQAFFKLHFRFPYEVDL